MSPETIEAVLADFRAWLQEAAPRGAAVSRPETVQEPVDLYTLLAQLTALRHEVHLQTRAARSQQEQTGEALQQLRRALDAIEEPAATDNEGELRPILKALLDVRDVLGLSCREVQRMEQTIAPALESLAGALEEIAASMPSPRPTRFWSRWLARPKAAAHQAASQRERFATVHTEAERIRVWVESLESGYLMSLQRLDRVLEQLGLERLECRGMPFDPETMEAVEAATGTGLPPGQVIEEIRPGYRWRDRVFRYAQVRVAKT